MTDAGRRLDVAAIILAGGRGSRLGQPKAGVRIAGETLLGRALRAVDGIPAVVVGGPELDPGLDGHADTTRVRESPPFAGPAAAVGAGMAELERRRPGTEWVLLLACDLPFAPRAVPLLVDAAGTLGDDEDGVCFGVDGREQWLCGVYRGSVLHAGVALVAEERGLGSAPLRAVFDARRLRVLDDADGVAVDIDTPDDLRRVAGLLDGRDGAPPGGLTSGLSGPHPGVPPVFRSQRPRKPPAS